MASFFLVMVAERVVSNNTGKDHSFLTVLASKREASLLSAQYLRGGRLALLLLEEE